MYQPEIRSDIVQYPSQDGTQINAYFSRPAAPGRYPSVVVIMEAFGLVDHTKDVARRFAEQGYLAQRLICTRARGRPIRGIWTRSSKRCFPSLTRRL